MDILYKGIPTMGCRYEVRYNQVGYSFSKSKILFATAYQEKEENKEAENEAMEFLNKLVKNCRLRSISEGIRASKGSYSEIFVCRAMGWMETEGFHSCAYYVLKRGSIPYSVLKEWLQNSIENI